MSTEPVAEGLQAWLDARPGVPLVRSELARVEVPRATQRVNEAALPAAAAVLPSFVAYDHRLAEAAATAGLDTVMPPP